MRSMIWVLILFIPTVLHAQAAVNECISALAHANEAPAECALDPTEAQSVISVTNEFWKSYVSYSNYRYENGVANSKSLTEFLFTNPTVSSKFAVKIDKLLSQAEEKGEYLDHDPVIWGQDSRDTLPVGDPVKTGDHMAAIGMWNFSKQTEPCDVIVLLEKTETGWKIMDTVDNQ